MTIENLQTIRRAFRARSLFIATSVAIGLLGLSGRPMVGQAQPAAATPPAPPPALVQARAHIAARRFASADTLLEALVKEQPRLAAAWLALGNTRRGLGRIDDAVAAFREARTLGARLPGALSTFLLYANARRLDEAATWLDTLRAISRVQGAPDFTTLATNAEVTNLKGDARFAMLFPDGHTYDRPFVEDVKIIHEWRGEAAGDEFGWIARALGDVDGDKVMDVVVSATANPPLSNRAGKVYVYSGKSGKLLWKQQGAPGSGLGVGLESAGDVNGDGADDVIAGAPGANAAFVYSGKDGKELLRLRGDSIEVNLGGRAAGIGDFNGDGTPDLLVGAFNAGVTGAGAGRAIVFSGKDGGRLLTIDGEQAGDGFGSAVGGGGGRFAVGAGGAGPNRTGRLYVYDRLTKTPLFVKDADSTAGGSFGGMFATVVGDLDGDGAADVYTSDFVNRAKGGNTGRAYIYSGKTGDPLHIITGEFSGEGFGAGAAYSGDMNGDNVPDLVIGSWQYGAVDWSAGRVKVFSGKDGRLLRTITGRIPGETLSFDAVGIGDVNGDGAADLLVTSAWSMVNGMRSGRVFIISGK